mgnify:CR=1 FL=1
MSINGLILLWCYVFIITICAFEGKQSERLLVWTLLPMLWACTMWLTSLFITHKNIDVRQPIIKEIKCLINYGTE